jgi:hypothetical protein
MANKDSQDVLVANTTTGTVSVSKNAKMPPTEPGHLGEAINPGEVFDPNAARRFAEGRGPGLQDSERLQPAHWHQAVDSVSVLDLEIERREQELDRLKKDRAEARKSS